VCEEDLIHSEGMVNVPAPAVASPFADDHAALVQGSLRSVPDGIGKSA